MEKKYEVRLMQTNLFTDFGNFFVSTAYRDDGGYYETFAWKVDENWEKNEWVGDATRGSGSKNVALEQHEELCRALIRTGEYEYDDAKDVYVSKLTTK